MVYKRLHTIASTIIMVLLVSYSAKAQYSEYEIKGTMVTTLAKYITWPEKVFNSSNTIVLGILGDDPFGNTIEDIIKGRLVKGRGWRIIRGNTVDDLRGSHIIFIGRSKNDEIQVILEEIYKNRRNASVLTIGDNIDNFCQYGGMMNYREEQIKYVFDLNVEAVTAANLRIDTKLLRFANEIVPNDEIKP